MHSNRRRKMKIVDGIKHAFNAFLNRDPTKAMPSSGHHWAASHRPDRVRLSRGHERSIIASVYNRIAIDVSTVPIKHVRLNDKGIYKEDMNSQLNDILTVEANKDQTARAFMQDVVMTLCDEGCIAIVPVDTDKNPDITMAFDIYSLRVGKIVEWFPDEVRVDLFNDKTGMREQVTVPKKTTAIIENPLYSIMNEPNSTLQRLITKLNLLDAVDLQSSSGKLDIIIQLPYTIKSETRRDQAEKRRKDIEDQIFGSKYGIAYTDATEKITQLNRPAENQLMAQIEFLTKLLYSQLGLSEAVFNGTADEKEMLNYYNRTTEPILSAIVDEMRRKFLTKTARSQKQSIVYIRDPFKLVSVKDLSEMADKFTRNEILSSNEVRAIIGFEPSDQEGADELRNKNLNKPPEPQGDPNAEPEIEYVDEDGNPVNEDGTPIDSDEDQEDQEDQEEQEE